MKKGCIAILDIGKTMAKLSLWSAEASLLARYTRANQKCLAVAGYPSLDVAGIDVWLRQVLATAPLAPLIDVIVPVGHGAAAVILGDSGPLAEPYDYEAPVPPEISRAYDALRSPFAETGSPALPDGLNLGRQLYRMQQMQVLPENCRIVPWAQYWSWRFCGTAASEVSSLGCHTDLWSPSGRDFSALAKAQGWDKRFAPIRSAGEVLGTVSQEWVENCGLSPKCEVLCGLHDSNAALLAIRGYQALRSQPGTVLSSGTWFVAMHSAGSVGTPDISGLSEARDCLVNVDVNGRAVPSARFMGGRECDLIEMANGPRVDILSQGAALTDAAAEVVSCGVMALPEFVTHVGPYPDAKGQWVKRPEDALHRRAAAGLYLALMAQTSLSLTRSSAGSAGPVVIEGRFADDPVFTRALAALMPEQKIYRTNAHDCVPFGALRLVNPDLVPRAPLERVTPLNFDITDYARSWHVAADASGRTLAA